MTQAIAAIRNDMMPAPQPGTLSLPQPYQCNPEYGPLARQKLEGRQEQRQRREEILVVTRRLVAERGFAGVSVKTVSDTTHISPQTIYNLVGPRREMIAASVCQYISSMIRFSHYHGLSQCFLVDLALTFGKSCDDYPDFMVEALKTILPPHQPLRDDIRRTGRCAILDGVRDMKRLGQLEHGSDIGQLTQTVILLTNAVLIDLANGLIHKSEVTNLLIQTYLPYLRASMTAEAFKMTQVWLNSRELLSGLQQ